MKIIICDNDKIHIQELRNQLELFLGIIGLQEYEIAEVVSDDESHKDMMEKTAVDLCGSKPRLLVIDCEGGCRKIDSDEIIMLEAQKRKIIMYTENNQYEVTVTMKEWNEKLSFPCFFQCHRSYIVNVAKISSIKDDMIFLKHGEYRAYLTKRKHAEVKNRFMLYLEKNR